MTTILRNVCLLMLPLHTTLTFALDCGDAEQCYRQADAAVQDGRFDDAFAAAQIACTQGSGDACAVVGMLNQLGKGTTQDSAQAVTYLQKACDLGSGDGCATLAGMYYNGNLGVPLDLAKAHQLAVAGCQADNAIACMVLGTMQLSGRGAEKDSAAGQATFAKACAIEPLTCSKIDKIIGQYKQQGIIE